MLAEAAFQKSIQQRLNVDGRYEHPNLQYDKARAAVLIRLKVQSIYRKQIQ